MEIVLRKAEQEDRERVIWVESKSTPNLSYVGAIWDLFTSDEVGEFSVAEADGKLVACGKFTVVPDGSAWLETLRVMAYNMKLKETPFTRSHKLKLPRAPKLPFKAHLKTVERLKHEHPSHGWWG